MSLLSPQLEAFMAIVQFKTVHRAAEALFITQTAVTQRIRGLEGKLKTSLFIRTRRGMALTPEGEALMHYCQAARDLEGEAMARISGGAVESDIRICLTGPTSLMRSRVVPKCLPILSKFPRLFMEFAVNDSEDRETTLKSGRAQLAILCKQSLANEMERKLLEPEEYVLVCSCSWKKRPLKSIIQKEVIIDFDPQDEMTLRYLQQYDLADTARPERHFVNRTETLAMMIREGYGYGVLTKELCQPYLRRGELIILNQGKTLPIEWYLAWYHRPEPPTYLQEILAAIV